MTAQTRLPSALHIAPGGSQLTYASTSEAQTESFAGIVAKHLFPGSLVALAGDLGSGKTCFVRGLATSLGIPAERVHSPTFTLINEYSGGRMPLYHIDLYRLGPSDVDTLALREYLYGDGVCAVEWFERLGEEPPHLAIRFTFVAESERTLVAVAHGQRYDDLLHAVAEELAEPGVVEKDRVVSLIVQKYGGTSVGSVERIKAVAQRVAATRAAGNDVIVVVSAMAGETNRLLALASAVATDPDLREVDALVATGEQVSIATLALALIDHGQPACSLLAHQVRISTDNIYGRARIRNIEADKIMSVVRQGAVAVVAGFQGMDDGLNITTLGRGGSDTSAIAVAAAVQADVCEIYTDVSGVYTADPRICPGARKLDRISYDEMLELASLGAKVLQIRSVEAAKRFAVPVHVRSSFSDETGTWVVQEDSSMENVLVSGVTMDLNEAKVTVLRVPDRPGVAASIFTPIAKAHMVVDMIIQNASEEGFTDLTFTVPKGDFDKALAMVKSVAAEIGAAGVVTSTTPIAKVSVVGLGMRSHAGVAARLFEVLSREGINVQMISTSEIKISVVIEAKYAELAVRVLHQALVEEGFEADAT